LDAGSGGGGVPGSYSQRLEEAEALVKRARTPAERKAFKEIAAIWRRLAEGEEPAPKADRPSGSERGG
jgi:ferric-dicitrate binding protein FerR (iron transport regulator)